ncbi:hypothetical protein VNO77_03470 [Canavalia gladiata]|uniref:Uncharacterized protein n=1 Tax=Canavalia gladiata TaxID=3824 RepID=A0AAN9R6V4_CANGL
MLRVSRERESIGFHVLWVLVAACMHCSQVGFKAIYSFLCLVELGTTEPTRDSHLHKGNVPNLAKHPGSISMWILIPESMEIAAQRPLEEPGPLLFVSSPISLFSVSNRSKISFQRSPTRHPITVYPPASNSRTKRHPLLSI